MVSSVAVHRCPRTAHCIVNTCFTYSPSPRLYWLLKMEFHWTRFLVASSWHPRRHARHSREDLCEDTTRKTVSVEYKLHRAQLQLSSKQLTCTCSFRVMQADRQTDRQTRLNRILHTPYSWPVALCHNTACSGFAWTSSTTSSTQTIGRVKYSVESCLFVCLSVCPLA